MSKYLLTIGKDVTIEYPTAVYVEGEEEFKELAIKLAYVIKGNKHLAEIVQTLLKEEDLSKLVRNVSCSSREEYERKVKEYEDLPDYVKRAMRGENNEKAKM
jgi:hypothetical protein